MRYRFCTLDVFTSIAFGGNQLAVLPDARGLETARMQQIAREFNYAESTVVLPARAGHTGEVRIFTPTAEVPFGGHPNVGTAFALASLGELAVGTANVSFEEKAGMVPISIQWRDGKPVSCELRAPQPLSTTAEISRERMAAVAGLEPGDVLEGTHAPQSLSVATEISAERMASLIGLNAEDIVVTTRA